MYATLALPASVRIIELEQAAAASLGAFETVSPDGEARCLPSPSPVRSGRLLRLGRRRP